MSNYPKILGHVSFNNYDDCETAKRFSGLSLLPVDEDQVSDAFTNDVMDDAPSTPSCVEFSDYTCEQYIPKGLHSTVNLLAAAPDILIRTTNGAESPQGHRNAQFYSAHPNIYVLVETLFPIQASIGI